MSTSVGELYALIKAPTDVFQNDLKKSEGIFKQTGAKLGQEADQTGKKIGEGLGKAGEGAKKAADDVQAKFAPLKNELGDEGKKSGEAFGDGFAVKAAIAGTIAGAGFISSLTSAMDTQKAVGKFAAQVGAFSTGAVADFGDIAGNLYANAWGESVGDVLNTIRSEWQNGIFDDDATNEEIESVTAKMIDLATVMDEDVGRTSMAVGQMIKSGIAENADEALDILMKGMQQGADKSQDLLDTFNEYPVQFQNMGLSGKQAMGIITQALQAGARDSDVVADTIKEFSIEAVAGGKRVMGGFKSLGLNAKEMSAEFAKGGPGAAKALDLVFDKLRAIEDPVKRNQAGIELFGTKAEDMGQALYAIDPSKAVEALGFVDGAAQRASDNLNNNAATNLESFKRKISLTFSDLVGGKIIPQLTKLTGWLSSNFGPALEKSGAFLSKYQGWLIPLAGGITAIAAAMVVASAATSAWAAATAVFNAVMAMNPIGLIVLAIIGLIAVIVIAWKRSETFRNVVLGTWDAIKTGVSAVVNFLKAIVLGTWNAIVKGVTSYVNMVKSVITTVWGWITNYIRVVVAIWATIIWAAWQVIKFIFDKAIQPILDVVMWMWSKITGFFMTGINTWKAILTPVFNWLTNIFTTSFNAVKNVVMAVWNWMSGVISTNVAFWRAVIGAVMGWISARIQTGINTVMAVWNKIKEISGIVSRAFTQAKDAVTSKFSSMVSYVKGKVTDFLKPFTDLVGKMKRAGGDAIQGVIDGIKEKVGGVKDAVGNVTGSIKDQFKKNMDIFSPSRVMKAEGMQIPAGVAEGIIDNAGVVPKAVTSMASMIKPTFNDLISMSPTVNAPGMYLPTGGSNRSGGPSSITVKSLTIQIGNETVGQIVDAKIDLKDQQNGQLIAAGPSF